MDQSNLVKDKISYFYLAVKKIHQKMQNMGLKTPPFGGNLGVKLKSWTPCQNLQLCQKIATSHPENILTPDADKNKHKHVSISIS